MLVCFMFCFTACGETLGENYWLDTSASLTQYFSSQEYKYIADISFSSNIKTIISSDYGEEFAELENVYAKLFTSSIFTAEKFATVLLVTPINTDNNFRKSILDVNDKLQDFQQAIKDFTRAKSVYEARIDFTDQESVASALEKSRLVKFKLDYLKVISSAYDLSNSLYTAYQVGYYNFSDYANIEASKFTQEEINANRKLALNGSNLQLVNSAIKVLNIYNTKEVYYSYNNYWQTSQKFFTDVVEKAYNSTSSTDTNILKKFVTWKGVYDIFIEDTEKFNNIVSNLKIDILKQCNNNTLEYARQTGNPLDQTNANFFLNYYKNIQVLYTYTQALV